LEKEKHDKCISSLLVRDYSLAVVFDAPYISSYSAHSAELQNAASGRTLPSFSLYRSNIEAICFGYGLMMMAAPWTFSFRH
jgi:hypothetical protein